MLEADKIYIVSNYDFEEVEIENRHDEEGGVFYKSTEMLAIQFWDENDDFVGDLLVYFVIEIIDHEEAHEVSIDHYYHIPCFNATQEKGKHKFLEDVEALQFIVNNFGYEVQEIIDKATDILLEIHESELEEDDV